MSDTKNISARIAEQNDRFRQGDRSILGNIVITAGIAALSEPQQQLVFNAVRTFDDFTAANDPHGERDFGAIEINDVGNIFWKMDYYDVNCEFGSEHPVDLATTRRILTIMFATEY